MSETVTFSVRMPRAEKARLEALAKDTGRSANRVAAEAIASYLDENAWQVEAVRAAVERADRGGPFYATDDVTAYLEARGRGEGPARPKPVDAS
jgi:predicted transcriptional regulator